jgi:hypothetical protein
MRRFYFILRRVTILFLACMSTQLAFSENFTRGDAEREFLSEKNKRVDLFPSQSMSTLVVAEQNTSDEIAKVAMPAPAALPAPPSFIFRGEWQDDAAGHTTSEQKISQRVVVVEGFNQIFLVCSACSAHPSNQTIRPGEALTNGYRFKQLDAEKVIVIDPNGQEQSLSTRG